MQYNVHSYLILRVQHRGIEADTPEAAIRKADALLAEEHPSFNPAHFGAQVGEVKLTSEVESYMVDPLDAKGDIIYDRAITFAADGVTRSATLQEVRV